jgi:hypothetical protein
MADLTARNNRVAMTAPELEALEQLVKSGDRAGFYLAYYGMTDSAEALMQSKIATFSGPVGGAAFAANRFLQDQYASNADLPYPGIYYLSQKVAVSAYNAIFADAGDDGTGTGKITEQAFFQSAKDAWIGEGIQPLFPGNLYPNSGLTWSDLVSPGAGAAFAGTLYAPFVGKLQSDFASGQIITLADGSKAAVDAAGQVQGVFALTSGDALALFGYGLNVNDGTSPDDAVLQALMGGQSRTAFTETNTTSYNGDVNPALQHRGQRP